jgi:nucleoside recognition membrane protein YjiH
VGRRAAGVLYVLVMVAVVVGVDILFFRHLLWERLIVNVGIILVFGAFYLSFLNRR